MELLILLVMIAVHIIYNAMPGAHGVCGKNSISFDLIPWYTSGFT